MMVSNGIQLPSYILLFSVTRIQGTYYKISFTTTGSDVSSSSSTSNDLLIHLMFEQENMTGLPLALGGLNNDAGGSVTYYVPDEFLTLKKYEIIPTGSDGWVPAKITVKMFSYCEGKYPEYTVKFTGKECEVDASPEWLTCSKDVLFDMTCNNMTPKFKKQRRWIPLMYDVINDNADVIIPCYSEDLISCARLCTRHNADTLIVHANNQTDCVISSPGNVKVKVEDGAKFCIPT